jgi:hypothetical protein
MFGLSFLNSSILFLSITAIIPLIIHLFIKRKPVKIYFSTLKLLKEVIEEKRKRMNLNQLILLILRMLILLFIALAIAKPVINLPFIKKTNYHPPTAIAFILDTSPHMDYITYQKSQIQHGIDLIKELNKKMNEKDISILFTSDEIRNAARNRLIYGQIPENEYNDIDFTWTPEPMNRIVAVAEDELNKSHFLHKEIYIISDGNDYNINFQSDIPITQYSTYNDSTRYNLSIVSVNIKKEPIDNQMRTIAEYHAVNHAPVNQNDQIVRLIINGQTIAEKMISFLPNEKKNDFFIINNENTEWNNGYVEIIYDVFTPDNRRYFTFYNDPNPKIAVINDNSYLPRSIEILAQIYVGKNGKLDYLNIDNIHTNDIEKYHFFIFNKTNYDNKTIALVKEIKRLKRKSLFLLNDNLTYNSTNFFIEEYNLILQKDTQKDNIIVNNYNTWHKIVSDFKFSSAISVYTKPLYNITANSSFTPIVSSQNIPIIFEKQDIFVNIDYTVPQNFLSYHAYPIILYRVFAYISKFDSRVNQYHINDPFNVSSGTITNPKGKEFDIKLTNFKFNMPGIWLHKDNNKISYIAVNMSDYENQSVYNKTKIHQQTTNENYVKDFLNNYGYEMFKTLLIFTLLFLLCEMALVLLIQNPAIKK